MRLWQPGVARAVVQGWFTAELCWVEECSNFLSSPFFLVSLGLYIEQRYESQEKCLRCLFGDITNT